MPGKLSAWLDRWKRPATPPPQAAGPEESVARNVAPAAHASARSKQAAEDHFRAGNLLLQSGKLEGASREFEAAVASDPHHANAHANLGAALKDRGRWQQAQAHLETALKLDPRLVEAAYNLAFIHIDRREWPAAAALLRKVLAADSRQPDVQYWLGNALMGAGDAAEARKAYLAAVRLQTGHVKARWGAVMAQLPAVALTETEQHEAVSSFGRELEELRGWLRGRRAVDACQAVGAQQPYYLAYIEKNHRELLARYGDMCASAMNDWAGKVGVPPPVGSGGRKQRIGIVSAHVHNHSVWRAIVRGWVEHLDPRRFELHLFHTGPMRDAETEWARSHVSKLHQGLGDWTNWAKTLSEGKFDVLIYPEIGMDATTVRLSALRLAPHQWASWGHPLTTGLPTIDAYLSAQAFEPADAQNHYTEKLICLPRLGCAYRPYETQVRDVDLAATCGITPGDRVLLCPGNSFKYAPRDDRMLVEVARRCRPCKLIFFGEPGDRKAALLETRLRAAFAEAGLDFAECVRFIPWQPQAEFFGLLRRADVFLDTAGFSGFNTAMQAIECDTPIVAWDGQFMRGRFASAILRELGLGDWVASTPADFAARVGTLCKDTAVRLDVQERIRENKHRLFNDRGTVDELAKQLQALRAQG